MVRNRCGRYLTPRCGRKTSTKIAPRLLASAHVPQIANDDETLLLPLSSLANNQVLPRHFHHFLGHHPHLVDLQNTLDLHQETVNQAKIAPGNTNNRCYVEYMPSDIVLSPVYLFKKDQRPSCGRRTPQLAWRWPRRGRDVGQLNSIKQQHTKAVQMLSIHAVFWRLTIRWQRGKCSWDVALPLITHLKQ